MGDLIAGAFGALALVGLTLIALGFIRRARALVLTGAAVLLALLGAWLLGPLGAALGMVAFGFWRRGGSTKRG